MFCRSLPENLLYFIQWSSETLWRASQMEFLSITKSRTSDIPPHKFRICRSCNTMIRHSAQNQRLKRSKLDVGNQLKMKVDFLRHAGPIVNGRARSEGGWSTTEITTGKWSLSKESAWRRPENQGNKSKGQLESNLHYKSLAL